VDSGILSDSNDLQTVRLRDGRVLAYAEAGVPDGAAVVSCHGTPSCRFPGPWAKAAEAAGVYFVQADRPGYGRSEFNPEHSLLEWAHDVADLADALGLRRFAVVGTSGGGPYAAACAYTLAERATALGLVCGVGPSWDVPEVDACATDESGAWIRELIDLARRDPGAAVDHAREECKRDAEMVERDPEDWVRYWFEDESVPTADRVLVGRPEDRAWMVESLREALRSGFDGYVQDELILTVRPWGFGAEQIEVPAYLWHGELDTFAPIGGARYLARVIPRCRAWFFADEAHMIARRHGEEILRALVEASSA
jgi:pimeloyl-ACP methyl ester carboxylesterase